MRGATRSYSTTKRICCHFNPRTPCGVRRDLYNQKWDKLIISIHAPHAGCDDIYLPQIRRQRDFNPRTPCGVRRGNTCFCSPMLDFNPRTPCGVRRVIFVTKLKSVGNFNPRTPCGVRRLHLSMSWIAAKFQSTHPMRGATFFAAIFTLNWIGFQSTHPMRGATLQLG